MKKLKLLMALFCVSPAFALADDNPDVETELISIKKVNKKGPNAPSRISMACSYHNGVLTFGEYAYNFMQVTVTHLATGQTWVDVVTPDNPHMTIGTMPGTYTITTETDGHQFFYGEITI